VFFRFFYPQNPTPPSTSIAAAHSASAVPAAPPQNPAVARHIEDVFKEGKRMLFLFDYGDEWHFDLTCTQVEPAATKRKVRKVLSESGQRPVQYPDCEEDDA